MTPATSKRPEPPPYGAVWRLAWPLILSNSTVPLLGMVDSAVVGHLPEPHHLGAVALGAVAISILYLAFGSARMATTGLTAQAEGAGDDPENRACLVRPLILAIVTGFLLVLVSPWLIELASRGFAPTPAVDGEFRRYMELRIIAAPAALANFVLLGWLLGNHDTRSQLVVLLVTNGVNAVLDVWFVLGLGWGVAGVAVATAIAESVGFLVALLRARRIWRRLAGVLDWGIVRRKDRFLRLFRVNGDLILRTLFMEAAFAVFAALSARQGEVVLAANAVLEHFLLLQAFALDGFAFAAEAMVGRAVGRRSQREFDSSVRAAAVWSIGFALALVVLFWVVGPFLIAAITSIPDVRATAYTFLPYLIVAPLLAVWAYLFDGIFAGATQTAELRNGTALASLLFIAAALTLPDILGNHGLWIAILIFKVSRGLWFWWRFSALRSGGAFLVGGPPAPSSH